MAPAPFVLVGAEVGAAAALAFSRIHPELVHQESNNCFGNFMRHHSDVMMSLRKISNKLTDKSMEEI